MDERLKPGESQQSEGWALPSLLFEKRKLRTAGMGPLRKLRDLVKMKF
ncbi:MAG: hypothetical protein FWC84_08750 [Alphaproteobacteria bacterium]|nr:hypothetical protein [Alphaproteobacteria bacterium]